MAADPNDPTAATGVFAPNPHPLAGADSVPAEPTAPAPDDPNQDSTASEEQPGPKPFPVQHPSARRKQQPDNFIERLSGLADAHPWMPFQTQATLAMLPQTDAAVASMAASLRKTYGSVDNAIKYTTDDPLLQKTPSLGLYIRSYLTNTIGPWPLADSDLVSVQHGLQSQGFAKGLPADGTWGPAWNSAFTQWSSNLRTQALGGSQPGSMPVGQALRGLNQLLPVESTTSIGGFISHIPQGVLQDIHTAAGAVSGGADALYQGFQPKNLLNPKFTPNRQQEAGVEASAENASTAGMGAHVTPQTAFSNQGFRTQAMDVLQVAGDLLATHGLLKAGSAVADAARATSWKSLDATAAERGPGAIAKSFFGHGGTVEDADQPLLSRQAGANVPIIRMSGPVSDAIAGGRGYYYRARTLLAAPYAVPGVRVAGTAVGQAGLAGAKIRGIASLESVVGGQTSPTSEAINHFQSINQLNDAVEKRLQGTAWGHHFDLSLNDLAWILHPPLDGPGGISDTVGSDMTGLNQASNSVFGPTTGFGLSVQRGVNWTKHGDQALSYDDLVNQAGGPQNFAQFWSSKIYQHAAIHLAESNYAKMNPDDQIDLGTPEDGTFSDRSVAIKKLADQYLTSAIRHNEWEPLALAARQMVSDDNPEYGQWGGHNGLSKRIAAEIERSNQNPKSWLKSNVANHAEASRIMRDDLVPRQNEFIADEVPDGTMGMARLDYKTSETAHSEINDLEKTYNAAHAALNGGGQEAWDNYQNAASAIRYYLKENFGIDGRAMPQDDQDMIKLLRQKADGQAHRLFPRTRPQRLEPGDIKPSLKDSPPTQATTLEHHTDGPLYSKMNPRQALEFIHEDEHGEQPWTNSKADLNHGGGTNLVAGITGGGVVIEHDPKSLYGETDQEYTETGASTYDRLRNIGRFQAQRNNVAGLNGIRSVEFSPVRDESAAQQSARTLLTDQLKDAGYIKFDHPDGHVKYVRPGLVGGTIQTSRQAARAVGKLKDLGYQPVLGTGIGFDFYKSPVFDLADSQLSTQRRFLERLGLSPENIPSPDIGFTWNMLFNEKLLSKIEKYQARIKQEGESSVPKSGEFRLYPTHTAQTVMAMMRDRDAIPATEGGAATAVAHTIGKRAYNSEFALRKSMLVDKGLSDTEAAKKTAAQMQQELENPLGLTHVTMNDLRHALNVRPAEGSQTAREADFRGEDIDKPMYDEKQINELYRTITETNKSMPARLMGWQKAENLTAFGLSYAGRAIPGSIGRDLERLPTRLVTLRNKARFTLSPEFALRRVAKVNVKMSLDGIAPTLFPMRKLMEGKSLEGGGKTLWKKAMADLDRIMPDEKNPEYDEGTQALYANDPWGIYNHRNYEAYATREWQKMGLSDTEIRQNLIKDFGYGSKAYGEGRSALERSANFVFFPLSFDKTLYRNTGAYLLDHTAQRLILQAGLEAYQRYNNSDPNGDKLMSSNWWLNHAPIINEALRLNAFAHGIGLGEFGGINAPLLNLFIPQSYASSSQGVTLLKGILPIIKEFQNVGTEAGQTFQVTRQAIADQFINTPALSGFGGSQLTKAEKLQTIFYAKPAAEDADAQLDQAYQYRRKLNAFFKDQIDYNAKHTTGKITLGNQADVFGQWAGATVNATLIDELAHQKYPAFLPQDPSIYYDNESAAIDSYAQQMKAAKRTDVVNWITSAQSLGNDVYEGHLTTSQQAAYTKTYRNLAVRYAETIPGFLDFYDSNFRFQFGPIEGVR